MGLTWTRSCKEYLPNLSWAAESRSKPSLGELACAQCHHFVARRRGRAPSWILIVLERLRRLGVEDVANRGECWVETNLCLNMSGPTAQHTAEASRRCRLRDRLCT